MTPNRYQLISSVSQDAWYHVIPRHTMYMDLVGEVFYPHRTTGWCCAFGVSECVIHGLKTCTDALCINTLWRGLYDTKHVFSVMVFVVHIQPECCRIYTYTMNYYKLLFRPGWQGVNFLSSPLSTL